jgi:hypothetical protein
VAALHLYRAAAQLEASRALAGQGQDAALADAQRCFALNCRHAERALAVGADRAGVTGPAGQSLAEWLTFLREVDRALAARHGFEGLREQAERAAGEGPGAVPAAGSEAPELERPGGPDAGLLPERGTPLSWQAEAGTAAPRLRLAAADARQREARLGATGQWLGFLLVAWLLAMAPALSAGVRRFWPEQVVLLGAAGWHLAGPTPLVLFLLLLGIFGRLLLLVRAARRLWRRRPAPSTAVPGGSP